MRVGSDGSIQNRVNYGLISLREGDKYVFTSKCGLHIVHSANSPNCGIMDSNKQKYLILPCFKNIYELEEGIFLLSRYDTKGDEHCAVIKYTPNAKKTFTAIIPFKAGYRCMEKIASYGYRSYVKGNNVGLLDSNFREILPHTAGNVGIEKIYKNGLAECENKEGLGLATVTGETILKYRKYKDYEEYDKCVNRAIKSYDLKIRLGVQTKKAKSILQRYLKIKNNKNYKSCQQETKDSNSEIKKD